MAHELLGRHCGCHKNFLLANHQESRRVTGYWLLVTSYWQYCLYVGNKQRPTQIRSYFDQPEKEKGGVAQSAEVSGKFVGKTC